MRLVGAEIGGNLECTGGHFSNPEGDALSAERIKVGDHVFLSNGFRGKGRISLAVATVSGGLVWTGDLVKVADPGITQARNPSTGQVARTRPADQCCWSPVIRSQSSRL